MNDDARPILARLDVHLDVADPRFLHPADMLAEVTGALDRLGAGGPVAVFGGGVRSSLYLCRLAERSGREVTAGPVEATALGNALVQGVALGFYAGLAEARGGARR